MSNKKDRNSSFWYRLGLKGWYWLWQLLGISVIIVIFLVLKRFSVTSNKYEITGLIINVIILWYTAILLLYYSDETKKLREEATKQRRETIKQINLSVRPLVVLEINERNIEGWVLHNIGNGPSLNIKVYRSSIFEKEFSHAFRTLTEDQNMSPIICLEKDGKYLDVYSSLGWYNGLHKVFEKMNIDRGKETWPLEFYIWVYFEDLIGGKFVIRHHVRVRDSYIRQNSRKEMKNQIDFNFNIINTTFDQKQNAKL